MPALEELGIDPERAANHGLVLYKVGMTWPLEPTAARRFCEGLEDVLVVEEKRPLVEEQLARLLYNAERRPRLLGKSDETGAPLVPSVGELSPGAVAEALRSWLERRAPGLVARTARASASAAPAAGGHVRLPSFCSGCPHNTSTVVPEGSLALGGIGCHGMAVWLPERRTLAVTQMGAEGANWIGQAPFTDTPHIFQNMGDGTYFHSGLLAIRAAVTAGVNITYKVLVNGAVAMTGGQPIEGEPMEGEVTAPEIARQLAAEGVRRIAVLSDDVSKYDRRAFPAGVTLHHRDHLDRVQRELRGHPGVSALVYDQICAAEARRLRKRGELPDPDRRVVINELVCEGCGDCSVQSNCISIEPVETELGRKRKINQSSCNKDYSCLKGYCPSFVSVIGGRLRRAGGGVDADLPALLAAVPEPPVAESERTFDILVGGIGGTGVVTVGALLGMAAHLEGKGVSTLDVTGLAQKNGPVTSHVRIARDPEALHATRIADGRADLLLGCDIVVSSGGDALAKLSKERTTAVVNTHVAPTSEFASHPDLDLSPRGMQAAIAATCEDPHFVDATRLATALLGDALASNLFLLGYALQRGRVPVGLPALERAIELNARAVEMNRRALAWGRLAAHDLAAVEAAARPALRASEKTEPARTLEQVVERRAEFLIGYQGERLARRYRARVRRVAERERERAPGREGLALAVARTYFKLRATKDEYEVARLWTNGEFARQLEAEFEGEYRLELHLAPPWRLNPRDPRTGRHRKWAFGPWMFRVLRLLARGKVLRGTPFDPCGWSAHRRLERQLVRDYEARVEELLAGLSPESFDLAVEIARIPELIRGFDSVKEEQLAHARAKEAELLAAFRLRAARAWCAAASPRCCSRSPRCSSRSRSPSAASASTTTGACAASPASTRCARRTRRAAGRSSRTDRASSARATTACWSRRTPSACATARTPRRRHPAPSASWCSATPSWRPTRCRSRRRSRTCCRSVWPRAGSRC